MQVIKYSRDISLPFDNGCVMALGFFDGVHLAHRALLQRGKDEAERRSLPLVVFTFAAEERKLKSGAPRLYSTEEKLYLLEECGADYVLLVNFSDMMDISPRNFVLDFLIDSCNVIAAVCGYNFGFGKGGIGNASLLSELLLSRGRACIVLDEYIHNGVTLSTTYIRALLGADRLMEAAGALGKPYFLTGKVTHGIGEGHSYGIPTVNIDLKADRYTLKRGVYASAVIIGGRIYTALTNIGTCPTFGERELHAETYILGFDGNLYNETIRIFFLKFLREERRFLGKEELIAQINVDKKEALRFIGDVKWEAVGLKLQ